MTAAGETYNSTVREPQHHPKTHHHNPPPLPQYAATTTNNIAEGSQGVTHQVPPGDVVSCDDHTLVDDNHGMMVHDTSGRLQWSFKFFENLHMDLRPTHMDHLRAGMER
jgi:hypothetical protein